MKLHKTVLVAVLVALPLLLGCRRGTEIVVKLPKCTPSVKTVVQACDSEVHRGPTGTSSWDDNQLWKHFGFENQTVTYLQLDPERGWRTCRQFEMCSRKSISDDYPVAVGQDGFWFQDDDVTKIWALMATAFRIQEEQLIELFGLVAE